MIGGRLKEGSLPRFNYQPGVGRLTSWVIHTISLSLLLRIFSSSGCAVDDNRAGSRKRIFVTSIAYTGSLKTEGDGVNGLAGANNLCVQAATNAVLGGSWDAWLSDSTIHAKDRFNGIGHGILSTK